MLTALALCEELFNTLMLVTCYPQHPFALPVRIVCSPSSRPRSPRSCRRGRALIPPWAACARLLAAALVYSALAVAIFDRGLQALSLGYRLLELR